WHPRVIATSSPDLTRRVVLQWSPVLLYSRTTAAHAVRSALRAAMGVSMHFGAFFYGTVDMPDAGVDGPPAHTRNYGQEDYRRAYADLLAYAEACDTLGYDSMWTAEHHFHNHGFEVVPNVVLLNAVLAQRT